MTKLLGIAIIRGWEDGAEEEEDTLFAKCLIQEDDGTLTSELEAIGNVYADMFHDEVKDEENNVIDEALDACKNDGIDTSNYIVKHFDYSDGDLRDSHPDTERLAYMLEFDKW